VEECLVPHNIDAVPESTFESQVQENSRVLWQGLLAGPVLYALYFITVYLLAEAACHAGLLAGTLGGLPLISVTVLVITLAAALCTLINGLSNYRRWRMRQRQPAGDRPAISEVEYATANPETAVNFMVFGGLLLSVLFTVMILLTGLPIFTLETCRWV
jgi:hypothetical protein